MNRWLLGVSILVLALSGCKDYKSEKRPCGICSGTGVLRGGQACRFCSGTGTITVSREQMYREKLAERNLERRARGEEPRGRIGDWLDTDGAKWAIGAVALVIFCVVMGWLDRRDYERRKQEYERRRRARAGEDGVSEE